MGAGCNSEDRELLYRRIDDLSSKSERGDLAVTDFLNEGELYLALNYLKNTKRTFFCFGGYDGAERQRIYLLPEYMIELSDLGPCDAAKALYDYGYSEGISAIRIKGSGYRKLTHRDVLGATLGLGLDRSVLGDILFTDGEGLEIVLLCEDTIADFIINELSYVANDKVKREKLGDGEWAAPQKRVLPISDTVASGRLDAVVGALCNLSREKARTAVESGLVELNYECEERPDRTVDAPAVISVRGVGKFRVLSLSDKTRKGRYRLFAEKYM